MTHTQIIYRHRQGDIGEINCVVFGFGVVRRSTTQQVIQLIGLLVTEGVSPFVFDHGRMKLTG